MDQTEKLSISLPASLAKLVRDKVKSGAYASNSEFIRDALRTFQELEVEREQVLSGVRERLARSLNDPRRSLPAAKVFDEMRERYTPPAKARRRAK